MMAGKILMTLITTSLYLFSFINGTEGLTPPLARLQCTEQESCRYVFKSYNNEKKLCAYYDPSNGPSQKAIKRCIDNNSGRRDKKEIDNNLYPYYYYGKLPKCPPLEDFRGGYWSCQDDILSDRVTVYTSCQPICMDDRFKNDFYVRCNESRKWEHLQKPKCVTDTVVLEDFNAPEITLETSTPMDIKVSWPDLGDVKVSKFILYLKSAALTVLRNITVSADATSYRFRNLNSSTTYLVQLKVVSVTGYEALSTSTNITTHSQEIFQARNITWNSPSPSQIFISWSPAPDSIGVVMGYSIYSNSMSRLPYKCMSLSPLDTFCELRNLTEGTKYRIVLQTRLRHGVLLNSEVTVETEEFNPLKPVSVKVQAINTTAIHVQFSLPDQEYFDVFVTRFRIDISGAGTDYEVPYSSNTTHEYVVSGLKPATLYYVQIGACTHICKGEKSEAVSVWTLKASGQEPGINYTVLLSVGIPLVVLVLIGIPIAVKKYRRKNKKNANKSTVSVASTTRTDFKSGSSSENKNLLVPPSISSEETLSGTEGSETGSGSTGSSETGSNGTSASKSVRTDSTVIDVDNEEYESINLKDEFVLNPHSLSDYYMKEIPSGPIELSDAPPLNVEEDEFLSVGGYGNGTIKNDEIDKEKVIMKDDINIDLHKHGDKPLGTKTVLSDNHSNEPLNCVTKQEMLVTCPGRGKRNIGCMAQLESDDDPPLKLTDLTVTAKSPSSISLSWDTQSQHPRTFTILFSEINSEKILSSALTYDTGKCKSKIVHEITDLKEDTEYEIWVSSSNPNRNTSYPDVLKARTLKINCEVTMVTAFESTCYQQFFKSLGHKLDPDIHGDQKNWKGLFQSLLGFDKDHIKAIRHHTKGDPDNGHFMHCVEHFRYRNLCLGHILEYFTRTNSLRKDVIQLFSDNHKDCRFCDKIYKQHLWNADVCDSNYT